jgi:hypothetical protein
VKGGYLALMIPLGCDAIGIALTGIVDAGVHLLMEILGWRHCKDPGLRERNLRRSVRSWGSSLAVHCSLHQVRELTTGGNLVTMGKNYIFQHGQAFSWAGRASCYIVLHTKQYLHEYQALRCLHSP